MGNGKVELNNTFKRKATTRTEELTFLNIWLTLKLIYTTNHKRPE